MPRFPPHLLESTMITLSQEVSNTGGAQPVLAALSHTGVFSDSSVTCSATTAIVFCFTSEQRFPAVLVDSRILSLFNYGNSVCFFYLCAIVGLGPSPL